MGIILFFKNIIKPKNWPLLFFILLNLALISFLLIWVDCEFDLKNYAWKTESWTLALIGIGVYFILLFLNLTTLGEIYLRFTNGLKVLNRTSETEGIYQLFDEVYAKARAKNKGLSKKVKLCLYESEDINAMALGRTTLAISTGLLALGDEEIKGIIAHEFGHLATCDSLMNVALIASNSVLLLAINVVKLFFLFFLYLFSIIFYSLAKVHPDDRHYTLCKFFSFLVQLVYTLWILIGKLFMMATSRKAEYKADAYSKDLGYGEALANALAQIDPSINFKASLAQIATSSHPETSKRIEKLLA